MLPADHKLELGDTFFVARGDQNQIIPLSPELPFFVLPLDERMLNEAAYSIAP